MKQTTWIKFDLPYLRKGQIQIQTIIQIQRQSEVNDLDQAQFAQRKRKMQIQTRIQIQRQSEVNDLDQAQFRQRVT